MKRARHITLIEMHALRRVGAGWDTKPRVIEDFLSKGWIEPFGDRYTISEEGQRVIDDYPSKPVGGLKISKIIII